MYYVLLNPGTRVAELITDFNHFPKSFSNYKDAWAAGDEYLNRCDCSGYEVLGVCTDDKYHFI